VVQADNSKPAPGSPTADVLPLAGDFFVPGGLYRPVRLVTTDALHFDMLDSGGTAVYATTRSIEGGRAQIDLSARVVNAGKAGQTALVRLRCSTPAVRWPPLPSATAPGRWSASTAEATLALPAAHLWQGVDDPYLYTLRAEIVTRGGSVADRLDQRYGIRQFTIDPEKGFFLNGRPYPLRGVGYHQDNEAHGWAIQPADVEADVRTLREMGANSIRLTHYQHGATIHDLADRLGLIVWDEIPLVSQWTLGGAKTASDGLRANARQQLAELIAQNRNHASVAVWSIANEVDFGNSLPMFLTGGSGTRPIRRRYWPNWAHWPSGSIRAGRPRWQRAAKAACSAPASTCRSPPPPSMWPGPIAISAGTMARRRKFRKTSMRCARSARPSLWP
jgi:beta-galactosidase